MFDMMLEECAIVCFSIVFETTNWINICAVVKLREREGQRVDTGRSLNAHL